MKEFFMIKNDPSSRKQPERITPSVMARMKLQKLQSHLQDVDGFLEPKLDLEQYETTPHLAACMLHTIESCFGDIDGRLVADLGCGTGRLTIGAAMLGAQLCVGVDIDSDALEICRHNIEEFDLSLSTDLVQMDIMDASVTQSWARKFDCVVMNPPFGTKNNKGIDMQFVRYGLSITRGSVYSLHKTSTRQHVEKVGTSWGATVQVLAELKFDLPSTYSFHQRASQDIEVDLIRFTINDDSTMTPVDRLSKLSLNSAVVSSTASKNDRRKDKTVKLKGKASRR